MRRGVRVFAAIALTAVVGVSACAKKKPVPPPAAAAARARRAAQNHAAPPPPPPPPAPSEPAPRPLTEDEIFAQDHARRAERAEAAGRRLLRPRLAADSRRCEAGAPEERRLDEALAEHQGDGRRARRLARHRGIQPRPRRAPRQRRPRLPGQPRRRRRSRSPIVSKGKEAPVCTEENETCWQQNRRGHFVITAK